MRQQELCDEEIPHRMVKSREYQQLPQNNNNNEDEDHLETDDGIYWSIHQ